MADTIKQLHRTALLDGGRLSQKEFYRVLAADGIDAKPDQERYIIRGEAIVPAEGSLGADYVLEMASLPRFEPGFDVSRSINERKVVGVKSGGPAERAGLRDGMVLQKIENSNRFSNGYKRDAPLSVWVVVEGAVKRIDYLPHGETIKVPQFRRR